MLLSNSCISSLRHCYGKTVISETLYSKQFIFIYIMAVFLQLLGGTLDISPKNPNTLSAIINNKNYSLSRQIKQINESQSENEMCYPDKDYILIISGCK